VEQLKDGTVKIFTGDWPTFLYDEDIEYDPEEKDKGLLRGYLLLRVSETLSLFCFRLPAV